jgi:hypothetical protein
MKYHAVRSENNPLVFTLAPPSVQHPASPSPRARIAGLASLVAAVVALSACGGGNEASSDAGTARLQGTPAPAPASAPVTAPATAPAPSPTSSPSPAPGPAPDPGTAPTPIGLTSGCAQLYGGIPNFALSTSRNIDPIVSPPKPVKGQGFLDATYKTCMVRATDHKADLNSDEFLRNDYARRQAFNADSSRHLAYAMHGGWHVYDVATSQHLGGLRGPGGDSELQWDGTVPNRLYYLPTNGVGMKLYQLDLGSTLDPKDNLLASTSTTVGDFAQRVTAKWPKAKAVWTKSEGSPSKDSRYWCFMVDAVDDVTGKWSGLGLFTWDRATDTILGMTDHPGGVRPDSVSMSPSGDYCVWYGDTVQAFTRDLGSNATLVPAAEHSDIGIDANGDDVFISVDYQANGGPVYMVNLRTKVRTDLVPTYVGDTHTATALHISAKSFNKPGWFLLETYADYTSYGPEAGRQWLHKKLMAVQMKAAPTIYNVAFTRAVEHGYFTEPHGTVNREFTKVLFTSNWNRDDPNVGDLDVDIDAYMVQLPVGALK